MKNKLAAITLAAGLIAYGCGGSDDNDIVPTFSPTATITPTPTDSPAPGRNFFVRNTQSPSGDGSQDNPFATLAEAVSAANQEGDTIFVFRGDGSTTGLTANFPMLTGQRLIGEGVGLESAGIAAGQQPAIAGTVQVGSHATVSGVNITANRDAIYGSIIDSATITHNSINVADGNGINLEGAIGNVTVSNNLVDFQSTTLSSAAGISINNIGNLLGGGGTLTLGKANLVVENNVVDGNDNAPIGIFVIPFLANLDADAATTSTIGNNTVTNTTQGGLAAVSGLSLGPATLNVTGNRVEVTGSADGMLTGNLIPIQIGGTFATTKVSGNNITTDTGDGIGVSGTASVEENRVTSTGGGLGIGIGTSSGFGLPGAPGSFVVRANTIESTGGPGLVMLHTGNSGVVQVIDNVFLGTTNGAQLISTNVSGIVGFAVRRNTFPSGNTAGILVSQEESGILQAEITDNTAANLAVVNNGFPDGGVFQVEDLANLGAINGGAAITQTDVVEGTSNLP